MNQPGLLGDADEASGQQQAVLGEQRLGGFLLWQSANSEFYFCEALWPDFRRVDFLRALRAYSERHRRFGV